ncbi:MAG: hypothetical protein ACXW3D_08080 [Caulobacteraceae bacterium]
MRTQVLIAMAALGALAAPSVQAQGRGGPADASPPPSARPAPAAPAGPNPKEYMKWTPLSMGGINMNAYGPTTCAAGDLVIRTGGSREGTYPLIEYGKGIVGEVTIGDDAGTATLLTADAKAGMAGVGGLGTFKQCG